MATLRLRVEPVSVAPQVVEDLLTREEKKLLLDGRSCSDRRHDLYLRPGGERLAKLRRRDFYFVGEQ